MLALLADAAPRRCRPTPSTAWWIRSRATSRRSPPTRRRSSFNSTQALSPADTDGGYWDLYLRSGGTYELLSIGPAGGGARGQRRGRAFSVAPPNVGPATSRTSGSPQPGRVWCPEDTDGQADTVSVDRIRADVHRRRPSPGGRGGWEQALRRGSTATAPARGHRRPTRDIYQSVLAGSLHAGLDGPARRRGSASVEFEGAAPDGSRKRSSAPWPS